MSRKSRRASLHASGVEVERSYNAWEQERVYILRTIDRLERESEGHTEELSQLKIHLARVDTLLNEKPFEGGLSVETPAPRKGKTTYPVTLGQAAGGGALLIAAFEIIKMLVSIIAELVKAG